MDLYLRIQKSVFREESEDIMAVPAVFLDGEEFGNGRMTISDILPNLVKISEIVIRPLPNSSPSKNTAGTAMISSDS
jgi:hypothetical protein